MSSTYKAEQIEAINYDGSNLLVSASAGSGKTFVMIERLINIIKTGKAQLDNILAVTFTEDASLQMKQKLKKALVSSIEDGQTELAPMLSQVNTADISTLHAFCGRLIRKYFFKVGVSPDFVILDQNKAMELKTESVCKALDEFYKKGEKDFLELVDKLAENRQDGKLKEIVLELFDFFSVEANPIEYAKSFVENKLLDFNKLLDVYYSYLKEELVSFRDIAKDNMQKLIAMGLKSGASFAEQIILQIDDILAKGIYAVKEYDGCKIKLTFERNLTTESAQIKQELTDVRDRLHKIINEFSNHLTTQEEDSKRHFETLKDAKLLVEIVECFTGIYGNAKREENCLDFADLEHYALRILRYDDVLLEVKQKYKYIFVDEYQDINGVQEAIISSISNNNVFMVGDVKQSIYGFRGCKPEIFTEKLKNEKDQKTILLNYNFRSANAILELVNKIFLYAMTEEHFGFAYKNSTLVSGGVFDKNAEGRTEIHVLEKQPVKKREEETPRIYDLMGDIQTEREQEEDNISALVTNIIEKELHGKIYDAKEKKFRNARFGDICILTRNRENAYVSRLVSGLIKRDIPVVSEVKQNVCSFSHVQTLINVLKLIDNFSGDIPLASTLKSAVGKFSDEDLASVVLYYKQNNKSGCRTFYQAYKYCVENMQGVLANRLKAFDQYFHSIRVLADFCGAHDILQKVLNDCDMEAEILAQSRGKFKHDCLKKFINASVIGEKKLTVREFLKLIENCADLFTISPNVDEDNVRVMTMHSSKGLEFPIVIICGLEHKMRTEEDRHILFKDRKHGFALKHYDLENRRTSETIIRGIIKQKSIKDSIKEELRLMYVALTRATYSMHLIYEGDDKGKKNKAYQATCFWDYIPENLQKTIYSNDDFSYKYLPRENNQLIFGTPNPSDVENIKANLTYQYPYSLDTKLPLKTSFSELANVGDSQSRLVYINTDGKTDAENGIIAHKILENFNFCSNQDVYSQANEMLKQGLITKDQLDKVDIGRINDSLQNEQLNFIKDCSLYREQGFLAMVDASILFENQSLEKVLVQGKIDLLAIKGEKGYIVDYKYSTLTMDSLAKKYKKQLMVYESAVKSALNLDEMEKYLVNVFSGEVVRID